MIKGETAAARIPETRMAMLRIAYRECNDQERL
jgi:hypothetical protein